MTIVLIACLAAVVIYALRLRRKVQQQAEEIENLQGKCAAHLSDMNKVVAEKFKLSDELKAAKAPKTRGRPRKKPTT